MSTQRVPFGESEHVHLDIGPSGLADLKKVQCYYANLWGRSKRALRRDVVLYLLRQEARRIDREFESRAESNAGH